jgi:hypothetical protein
MASAAPRLDDPRLPDIADDAAIPGIWFSYKFRLISLLAASIMPFM